MASIPQPTENTSETKVPKDSVNFRQGRPDRACRTCRNFLAPQSCAIVQDPVAADSLCDLFSEVDATNPQPTTSIEDDLFVGNLPNVG